MKTNNKRKAFAFLGAAFVLFVALMFTACRNNAGGSAGSTSSSGGGGGHHLHHLHPLLLPIKRTL